MTEGWTSHDPTAGANHWHVDTFNNPGSGRAAWCGDPMFAACGGGDVAGGYGNYWRDILEFRKTVGGVTTYHEDFEDLFLGPDWQVTANAGVGDFARAWAGLGDPDPRVDNLTNQVVFIDNGLVVPGTGGTIGEVGNDYGTPGGWMVNKTGGLLDSSYHLEDEVHSPVMLLPAGGYDGATFAFDIYNHELLGPAARGTREPRARHTCARSRMDRGERARRLVCPDRGLRSRPVHRDAVPPAEMESAHGA